MSDGSWLPRNCTLPDGTQAVIDEIRPEHASRLQAALTALRPESRYQRFLGAVDRLSPEQLRYLTHIDGVNHMACFMFVRDEDGAPHDLGVARCVRDPRNPESAEVAVVVAEEARRRGVAQALMRTLAERCREVGIRRWHAQMLAENEAVQRLLERFGTPIDRSYPEPGVVQVIYALCPVAGDEPSRPCSAAGDALASPGDLR